MKGHHLLLLPYLLGSILGWNSPSFPRNNTRPNIIFLLADDQRADAFGFMGNTTVITPNLDQLASESTVFENAYHVVPICQPSRASIMTGQYLGTHGAGFDYPANYVITESEFKNSYPVLLRQMGYYTGFIGKFGFPVGGEIKMRNLDLESTKYLPEASFDDWMGFPGQGSYLPRNGRFNGYENGTYPGPEGRPATHLTEFMGNQAIQFLRTAAHAKQPFCLSISFKAPHAPYLPAERFRQMYDNREIPRMQNDAPEFHLTLPAVVREKSRDARWYFGRTQGYYGEETGYRHDWHIALDSVYQEFIKNYYGLITGIDEVVGRIRAELRKSGADRNTIIVYTSDNGHFAGSRQLMGKDLLYEESIKAPLLVFDPRIPDRHKGKRQRALVSMIDIAPTLLDLAGRTAPENYPGKSILPLLGTEWKAIHEAVYGENNFDDYYPMRNQTDDPENYQSVRSRYVRTLGYKYIRYHENNPVTEELYDMDRDPSETRNLIDDPAYRAKAAEMRTLLDRFEEKHVRYGSRLNIR